MLVELQKAGYKATQATISRDIKELQLVKTLAPVAGTNMPLESHKINPFRPFHNHIQRNH